MGRWVEGGGRREVGVGWGGMGCGGGGGGGGGGVVFFTCLAYMKEHLELNQTE